jgi:hypothetical protein
MGNEPRNDGRDRAHAECSQNVCGCGTSGASRGRAASTPRCDRRGLRLLPKTCPVTPLRRGFCSLSAVLFVAEQLAGLPVDEMYPGARRTSQALVVLLAPTTLIGRLQQGLHLQ